MKILIESHLKGTKLQALYYLSLHLIYMIPTYEGMHNGWCQYNVTGEGAMRYGILMRQHIKEQLDSTL